MAILDNHRAAWIALALAALLAACSSGSSGNSSTGPITGTVPSPTMVAPVTTPEDTATAPISLTGTDAEDTEAQLTVNVSTAPTNGTLNVSTGAAPLLVVYTPNADYNGADAFQFTVTDTDGNVSAIMQVDVTVTPVNDAPTIAAIGTQVAEVGMPFSFTPTAADVDAGAMLSFALVETGLMLPTWATFDPMTGSITGTPAGGDVGSTAGLRIDVDDGIAPAVSSNLFTLTVTTVSAAQLAFDTPPAATEVAGSTWTPFTVRVEDSMGSLIPTSGVDVTLVLTTGTDTLNGTLTRRSFNGIATFDDISYNTAEAIVFDVTSTGLTGIVGTGLTITASTPGQLGFGTPPAAVEQQGTVFSSFSVQVQDAFGNVVTSDSSTVVQIALNSGTGTLGGVLSKSVTAGEAFFTNATYSKAETITLIGTSTGLTSVVSNPIIVQPPFPGGAEIERPSVATGGAQGNGASTNPDVSQSGRFVTFESLATSLVPGDSNSFQDIFVRDRVSGITSRVSVASGGAQATAGASYLPCISANGNFIAFTSDAPTLVVGDTNGARDVFVHNRAANTTVRVSVSSDGMEANGASYTASISGDGRLIAFASEATNLVAGDTNGVRDVFVHDRLSGTTTRVSVDSAAGEADGASFAPSLSFAGDTIAFESDATDLVIADTNGVRDVFMHTMSTGATVRCSVDDMGAEGNAASQAASINGNGTLVAFSSDATNLVGSDTNGVRDVFLHDTGLDTTTRVSVDTDEMEATAASQAPSISSGGRYVSFHSADATLVTGDTNGFDDIFVRDVMTSETYRVSLDRLGGEANGASSASAMSGDGRYVGFQSDASDLVPNDTNGVTDVFIAPNQMPPGGMGGLPTEIVRSSVDSAGNEGNSSSFAPSLSEDGRFIAFESLATDLVSGDTNLQIDIFVHDAETGITDRVSLSASGAQGIGESRLPSISGDGRYVAFESLSDNYVAGDTNGVRDIFVRDRVRGSVARASLFSNGVQLLNHSFNPSISADGRFVAFETLQDNIAIADTNGNRDVYVHDFLTGVTELVSKADDGTAGNNDSFAPAISPDGTYVAFHSRATNLVADDTTANRDVFVHDRSSGTTVRVSVDSMGVEANGSSFSPSISADGGLVVFESDATNLVTDDTNGARDVFAHDLASGATTRISVDSAEMEALGMSLAPSVSSDGGKVVFASEAANLVANDTNFVADVFLRDMLAGTTVRLSLDAMSMEGNGETRAPAISGDGEYTTFESDASDLVTGDTNGVEDIFTTPNP